MDNLKLAQRLFDIALFIIAVACLATAVLIGFFATHSETKIVIGLGAVASIICGLLEYRQKTIYQNDPIELSMISVRGGVSGECFHEKFRIAVARCRHKLVEANIIIVTFGICVSIYGAVWG